jgi:succinate dehydrogenase/fumarate reductase flavoprotein subunit
MASPPWPEPGPDEPAEVLTRLRRLMWERAGLIRSNTGLEAALGALAALEAELAAMRPKSLRRHVMAARALTTAGLVLRAALARRESRGAQYREDFPDSEPGFLGSHVFRRAASGGPPEIRFEPAGRG